MSQRTKWVFCRDTATIDLTIKRNRLSSDRPRGFWTPAMEGPYFFSVESKAKAFAKQQSNDSDAGARWQILPILEVDEAGKLPVTKFIKLELQ